MISVRSWGLASVALCAALVHQTASAEIVVGGGVGMSQLSKYDDVDEGTAYRAFAGYRSSDLPLYFEVQYFDSGDMDIDDVDDVSLSFDGFTAAVGFRLPLSDTGSDILIKGGGYMQDSKLEGPGGSADDDGSGGMLGIGGNWMFTEHFGLNLDVQVLFGVEDFANKEDLTLATVGLVYSFYTD
ncbi:outer membrane protein with beta-barrel domain [Panacagrimonas perspica]|uniref:Outer membrane protein with beta-barrel domain n=1 Tax=Panacagrimonas perspica TaxID=381431 RepID=A0A4R7NTG6_9GAMM|nr:outer membrane beta-barrel protein [Panacagrimonas perspica]TDU24384.1 outer membrane protein with beta-barrel domain [Panacagrimonas perspica]